MFFKMTHFKNRKTLINLNYASALCAEDMWVFKNYPTLNFNLLHFTSLFIHGMLRLNAKPFYAPFYLYHFSILPKQVKPLFIVTPKCIMVKSLKSRSFQQKIYALKVFWVGHYRTITTRWYLFYFQFLYEIIHTLYQYTLRYLITLTRTLMFLDFSKYISCSNYIKITWDAY